MSGFEQVVPLNSSGEAAILLSSGESLLKKTPETVGPCPTCPKRSTCVEICAELEALLPKANDFTPFQEIATSPSLMDSMNESPEPESDRPSSWRWADIADSVRPLLEQAMRESLTPRQREIVALVLDGSRQFEIAKALKVSRVTIFWIVKRAKAAIHEWFGGKSIKWERTTFESLVKKEGRVVFFSENDLISIYPKFQKKESEQMAFFDPKPSLRPNITEEQRSIRRVDNFERRISENREQQETTVPSFFNQSLFLEFSTQPSAKRSTQISQHSFSPRQNAMPRSGGVVLEMRSQRKGRR